MRTLSPGAALLLCLLLGIPMLPAVAPGQVPEGEKETLPGFMTGLDWLTHPRAYRAMAERIIESGSADAVSAALSHGAAKYGKDSAQFAWARTFQSLLESGRRNYEEADAFLSDATSLHVPQGRLRGVVVEARRQVTAARTYATWELYESRHFSVRYPSDHPVRDNIAFHLAPYDNIYKKIVDFFEHELDRKIDFYLYKDNEQCIRLTGFGLSFALPDIYEIHGSVYDPLGHEQAHIVSIQAAGHVGRNTMMAEGLAVFLDNSNEGRHQKTSAYFDQGFMIPLREMKDYFRQYPPDLTYAQAGSFVAFLVELYGRKRFNAFWRSNEAFEEAFERVYGLSFDDAESLWHKYLRGKSAEYRQYYRNMGGDWVSREQVFHVIESGDVAAMGNMGVRYVSYMPRYSLGPLLLGMASEGEGDFESALEHFGETAERYPQPEWLQQEVAIRSAVCHLALGDAAEARRALEALEASGGGTGDSILSLRLAESYRQVRDALQGESGDSPQ